MFFRVVEAWLTQRLLQSPGFHRVVRRVHRSVYELRHGKGSAGHLVRDEDVQRLGGTNFDGTGMIYSAKRFFRLFVEELRDQWKSDLYRSTRRR